MIFGAVVEEKSRRYYLMTFKMLLRSLLFSIVTLTFFEKSYQAVAGINSDLSEETSKNLLADPQNHTVLSGLSSKICQTMFNFFFSDPSDLLYPGLVKFGTFSEF